MTPNGPKADTVTNEKAPQAEPKNKGNVSLSISVVVGLGFIALLAFGFLAPGGRRPKVGEPAPGFALTLFDGSEVALNDLRGQVVVLNFWASWCTPCRQEAPELQAAWEAYQDRGVIFVGITYKDAQTASLEFVDAFGITYSNGFDAQGRISRAYGVVAVPETFIVDRDGNIAWLHIGALTTDMLSRQLERLQDM